MATERCSHMRSRNSRNTMSVLNYTVKVYITQSTFTHDTMIHYWAIQFVPKPLRLRMCSNHHWKSPNFPLARAGSREKHERRALAGAIRAAASVEPARKPLKLSRVSLWKRPQSLRRVLKRKASSQTQTLGPAGYFSKGHFRMRKRIWRLDLFLGTFRRLSKLLWELNAGCQYARK